MILMLQDKLNIGTRDLKRETGVILAWSADAGVLCPINYSRREYAEYIADDICSSENSSASVEIDESTGRYSRYNGDWYDEVVDLTKYRVQDRLSMEDLDEQKDEHMVKEVFYDQQADKYSVRETKEEKLTITKNNGGSKMISNLKNIKGINEIEAGNEVSDSGAQINKVNTKKGKEKQKDSKVSNMLKNMMNGAEYGEVSLEEVRVTTTGNVAFRDGDSWLSYDHVNQHMVNNYDIVLEVGAFKIPKPRVALKVGDLIIINGNYVFVNAISSNELKVINGRSVVSRIKETSNIVGMPQYFTHVVPFSRISEGFSTPGSDTTGTAMNPMMLMAMMSMMNSNSETDDEDSNPMMMMAMMSMMSNQQNNLNGNNPMTTMLPLMMMGGKSKGKGGMMSMLPLMMMGGQQTPDGNLTNNPINPMMLMAMMSMMNSNSETDDEDSNPMMSMLPLMMMGGQQTPDGNLTNNPMTTMLPLMMMGGKSKGKGGMMSMLPLMMMIGGQNNPQLVSTSTVDSSKSNPEIPVTPNPRSNRGKKPPVTKQVTEE